MSGPFQSRWYRISSPTFPVVGQQFYKHAFGALANYYDQHPAFLRIASNYGYENTYLFVSGSGLGTMRDWTQNPWDGCWGVWRAVSASVQYDVALIASDVTPINNYGASPWQPEGPYGSGIGIFAVASYHPSGAWNGTTANDGTDTFVTPWKPGSLTTVRCNASDGGNANLDATVRLTDAAGQFSTDNVGMDIFVTGDNETTYIAISSLKYEATYMFNLAVIGQYNGLDSPFDLPLCLLKLGVDYKSAHRGITIGEIAANSGGGGLITKTSDTTPHRFRLEYPDFMLTDGSKQSRVLEEDRFWEFGNKLYSYEPGQMKLVGTLSDLRFGAFSAGGSHRFYKANTRILLPILLGASSDFFGVVTLPWNGLLKPVEW